MSRLGRMTALSTRWRAVFAAAGGSVVVQVLSTAVGIVLAPVLLANLGIDGFGVYLAITSIGAVLVFADAGLGNGLVNAVSAARARGDEEAERTQISAAFFMLSAIALSGLVVVEVLVFTTDCVALLGDVPPPLQGPARSALGVYAAVFFLGLPLSLAGKVHLGRQEQSTANVFLMFGVLAAMAVVVSLRTWDASLPLTIALVGGVGPAAAASNTAWLFLHRHRQLRPSVRHFRRQDATRLARSGFLFLIIGMAGAIGYSTDNLIISHVLGPEAVPGYALPYRLFALAPIMLSFVLTPLWPALREALQKGENEWVAVTFLRLVKASLACNLVLCSALVWFGNDILDVWVGPAIQAPTTLLLLLAAWTLLTSLGGPVAVLLNAAGVLRFQVVIAVAMAVLNLLLSLLFTRSLGIVGPALGSLLAQLLCITLPSIVYLRRSGLLNTRPASRVPFAT